MSSSDSWTASQRFYRGRAKVRLNNLDVTGVSARTTREEHIQVLVEKFQSEGCIRLNPDNFIKALVCDNILPNRDDSEIQTLDLPDDIKLTVFHGKHRVLAADRFLWDKLWIADLYSESLPREFQVIIREEHPNAQPFCDGDIYQNIRMYQELGDVKLLST
ncbi:hypothetical protein N7532_002609 [Penicillium argentinense]|uniref:Uncharacterized protein n=1 Tax=Penicillium argentinense TaxID=1131581 RepID=A0A9W9KKE4_9EURO|nr:uncharacterized protein N7532_002609 [Penicillium argentinense]KAJ5109964.1 hypothetical protein N7532_002609 [Penicillium argentinense]